MNEVEIKPASAVLGPTDTKTAAIAKSRSLWKALPRSLQIAIPFALLVAGVLAAYLVWGVGESFVQLECHHNFKTAELRVSVDGWRKHTANLSGSTSRKLFGSRTVGLYSKQLAIRPGHHTIEVEIEAPGYKQTKTISADLVRDSESVLDVNVARNALYVGLRSQPPQTYASTSGAIRSNPLSSLMLTIAGSALSAMIGFYVQEFLRSRRAKPPA
jgi:hypothetical protein